MRHQSHQPRSGWAQIPAGLVVGLPPATLEFWVRFPNDMPGYRHVVGPTSPLALATPPFSAVIKQQLDQSVTKSPFNHATTPFSAVIKPKTQRTKQLGSTFAAAVGPLPRARLPTQGFIEVCVRSLWMGDATSSGIGLTNALTVSCCVSVYSG